MLVSLARRRTGGEIEVHGAAYWRDGRILTEAQDGMACTHGRDYRSVDYRCQYGRGRAGCGESDDDVLRAPRHPAREGELPGRGGHVCAGYGDRGAAGGRRGASLVSRHRGERELPARTERGCQRGVQLSVHHTSRNREIG